ncbi:MAG: HNH endonuclease [Gemmatimonadetes bacterium]|nr:HNH endonuclease [Gemmatimonadota bacterium]MYB58504.1 HNH endonuclease [Gemmatimonadota bacterium]
MIKLTKCDEPRVLVEKGQSWKAEYIAGVETGNLKDSQRYRYRHRDIKEALRTETHEKCAYCESKISHVHPGEIDHISPVSHRPDLCVEWNNLTLVCSECNRRKSDYYNEEEPLINPYIDEPSEHLIFFGPLVLHRDAMGFRTTKQIELSRTQLIERKQERIEQLNMLVQQWREMPNGSTRQFLWEEIMQYASDDAEFAGTIRAFISVEMGKEADVASQE